MDVHFTFLGISASVGRLFVLVSAGYVIYRIKLIDDAFLDKLSLLIIKVIFPSLIISKTITNFSYGEFSFWWLLPLFAAAFAALGMAAGSLVTRFLGKPLSSREFICSCGFQNCGYLPMNLILFAFAGSVADRMLVYMFLFIVGFNLLMFSLVPLFLSGSLRKGFSFKTLLNAPVVATVFSLVWVALFGRGSLPGIIMEPLTQVGKAAFPLVMLTLGAYLCRYKAYRPERYDMIAAGLLVKLVFLPIIVLPLVYFIKMDMDLKLFLFLESVMPTAVTLVVIGGYTGADNRFFSSIIFYSHLAAFLSIPLWMEVFRVVFGV